MNFARRKNPKLERSSRNWQTKSMTLESATICPDNQRSASRGPSFKMRLPMRYSIRSSVLTVVSALCIVAAGELTARAQEKYTDFNDAYAVAARLVRKGDYPAAVAPLEAALMLAKDDADRKKAYEALVPAYRLQPEIDKMLVAQEFIIRHTDRRAGRSIAAREVASFLLTRGKLDAAIERYDAQLKKDPN